jgi:hypothetical protein
MVRALDEVAGERLLGVRHLLYLPADGPRWLSSVELSFERSTMTVAVDGNTDTLFLRSGALEPAEDELIADAKRRSPWAHCMGKILRFAWVCVNQSGYIDAIQLGFNAYNPTVSLVAAGSKIHEYAVVSAKSFRRSRTS